MPHNRDRPLRKEKPSSLPALQSSSAQRQELHFSLHGIPQFRLPEVQIPCCSPAHVLRCHFQGLWFPGLPSGCCLPHLCTGGSLPWNGRCSTAPTIPDNRWQTGRYLPVKPVYIQFPGPSAHKSHSHICLRSWYFAARFPLPRIPMSRQIPGLPLHSLSPCSV